MIAESAAAQWDLELDDLFLTIGHRFGRVELRRRMRDYVRGLLAPVARKNSWQLAGQAGHSTPDGLRSRGGLRETAPARSKSRY
ncbi:transposase, partial [Streptomyces sp. PRh5]